jgi:WD40 repeat protein
LCVYSECVGHAARIFSLALCTLANGNRIAASASHDRTVRIWCLTTNTHICTLTYKDFVWRVFLVTTAVGRVCVIAFVSANDSIHVTDFETGEEMYVVPGRLVYAGIINLYNSPVIVTLINDVDLAIVDAETGVYIRYIRSGFEKAFRAVVSNTSHPVLVFNTWNAQNRRSSIQAYQLYVDPSEAEQRILPTHNKPICNLTRYTWSNFHGPARDDPIVPEHMRTVFEGDSRDGITSLVISQVGKPVICSGHYDNVVRVWDLRSLQLLLILEGHYDWVVSVTVWKGIEPLVISGSSDGTIKVWDLEDGSLICTCEGHLRDVWAVTVTTGPRHLIVSASADRTVRTWDINHVLMDMRWARRSNFALFLACFGLVSRPSSNASMDKARIPLAVETDTKFQRRTSCTSGSPLRFDDFNMGLVTAAVDADPAAEIVSSDSDSESSDNGFIAQDCSPAITAPTSEVDDKAVVALDEKYHGEGTNKIWFNENLTRECALVTTKVFQNVNLTKEIAAFL